MQLASTNAKKNFGELGGLSDEEMNMLMNDEPIQQEQYQVAPDAQPPATQEDQSVDQAVLDAIEGNIPDQKIEDLPEDQKLQIDAIIKSNGGKGFGSAIELFKIGHKSFDITHELGGILTKDLLIGDEDKAKKIASLRAANKYLLQQEQLDEKSDLPQVIQATAKVLGGIWGGMTNAWEGALAGAALGAGWGAAFGAGAAVPTTGGLAAPATGAAGAAIGAGIGASRGFAVETFRAWANQGAGESYLSMTEAGIDDKTATKISVPAGIVYGAIEQMTRLIPGQPAVVKVFKNYLQREITKSAVKLGARYAVNVAGESVEEGLQQVVMDRAFNIAADVMNSTKGTDIEQFTSSDVFQRALKAGIDAIGPAMIIGGAGTFAEATNQKNFSDDIKALEKKAGLSDIEAQAIFDSAKPKDGQQQGEAYIDALKSKILADNEAQAAEDIAAEERRVADLKIIEDNVAEVSEDIKKKIATDPNADIDKLAKSLADASGQTVEEMFPEGVSKQSLADMVGVPQKDVDLSDEALGAQVGEKFKKRKEELVKQLGDKPSKKDIRMLDKALREEFKDQIPVSVAGRKGFNDAINPVPLTPEQVIESTKQREAAKAAKAEAQKKAKTKAVREVEAAKAAAISAQDGGMKLPVKAGPIEVTLSNGESVSVSQDKPVIMVKEGESSARQAFIGPNGKLAVKKGAITKDGTFIPDKEPSYTASPKNIGKGWLPINAKTTARNADLPRAGTRLIYGNEEVELIDGKLVTVSIDGKNKRVYAAKKIKDGSEILIPASAFSNREVKYSKSKRESVNAEIELDKKVGGSDIGSIVTADDEGKAKDAAATSESAPIAESSEMPTVYGEQEKSQKQKETEALSDSVASYVRSASPEDANKFAARVEELKKSGKDVVSSIKQALSEVDDYSTYESSSKTLSRARAALAKDPNNEELQATVAKATREVEKFPEHGALAKKNEEYASLAVQLDKEKKYLAKLPSLVPTFGQAKVDSQIASRTAKIKEIEARMAELSGEDSKKSSIDKEAEDFISASQSGVPAFVTKNLEKIARNNGVDPSGLNPQQIRQALVDIRDSKDSRSSKKIASSDPIAAIRTEAAISQSAKRMKGIVKGSITKGETMTVTLPGGMRMEFSFRPMTNDTGRNFRIRNDNGDVVGWKIWLDPRDASPVTVWHEGHAGHAAWDMLEPTEKAEIAAYLRREGIFQRYERQGREAGWWSDKWNGIQASDEVAARYISENIDTIMRFSKQQTKLGKIWSKIKQLLETITGGTLFSGAREQALAESGRSKVSDIASGRIMRRDISSVNNIFVNDDIRNVSETAVFDALNRANPTWKNAKLQSYSAAIRKQLESPSANTRENGLRLLRQYGANELADRYTEETRAMLAHHGTPHKWLPEPGFPHGRIRLDKIGSGEGTQAFGWGWYSAEHYDVASSYSSNGVKYVISINGRVHDGKSTDYESSWAAKELGLPEDYSTAISWAAQYLYDNRNDTVMALKNIQDDLRFGDFTESGKKRANNAREIIEKYGDKISTENAGGVVYKLDIPDDVIPKLLDWDKEVPQSLFFKIKRFATKDNLEYYSDDIQRVLQRLLNESNTKPLTGERLYSRLANEIGDRTTSEFLNKVDVPGLKYLDAYSRPKKEGTRNYVIWDQPTLDRVSLLERNGQKLDDIRSSARSTNRANQMEKTLREFKSRLISEHGQEWRKSDEWKKFIKSVAKSGKAAELHYPDFAKKMDFDAGINIAPEADVKRHIKAIERDNPKDVEEDITRSGVIGKATNEYRHNFKSFLRKLTHNLPLTATMISKELGKDVRQRLLDSGNGYAAIKNKAFQSLKDNKFDKMVAAMRPDEAVSVRLPNSKMNVRIPRGMLLSYIRLTQNPSGRRAIMAGGNFGIAKNGPKLVKFDTSSESLIKAADQELEAWGRRMLASNRSMADMHNLITKIMDNDVFPELARVYKSITGKDLKKENAYIAIQRIGDLDTELENRGMFARLLTDWKSLDTRTTSDRPILITDATSSMYNSLENASRFIGYAENMRYLRGLLGSSLEDTSGEVAGSLADTIDAKLGAGTAKFFLEQLQSTEGSYDKTDWKFVRRLVQRQDVARLMGPSTMLKQFGAIFMPLLSMDITTVMRGFASPADKNLINSVKLSERGNILRLRLEQSQAADEFAEVRHNRSRVERVVEKWAFTPMRWADAKTVEYYIKMAREYVNDSRADLATGSKEYYNAIADKATEMVNDFQPTGLMEYRTAYHNSGLFGQMINRYRTSVNAINATIMRKYIDAKRDNTSSSRAALFASLATPIMAQAAFFAMADIMLDAWKDSIRDATDDDDDKKKRAKERLLTHNEDTIRAALVSNKAINSFIQQAPMGSQIAYGLGPVIEYLTTRRPDKMSGFSNLNTGTDPMSDFFVGARDLGAAMIKMAEIEDSGDRSREANAKFAKAARNAIDASMKVTQYMPIGNTLPQVNKWLGISRFVEKEMRE